MSSRSCANSRRDTGASPPSLSFPPPSRNDAASASAVGSAAAPADEQPPCATVEPSPNGGFCPGRRSHYSGHAYCSDPAVSHRGEAHVYRANNSRPTGLEHPCRRIWDNYPKSHIQHFFKPGNTPVFQCRRQRHLPQPHFTERFFAVHPPQHESVAATQWQHHVRD